MLVSMEEAVVAAHSSSPTILLFAAFASRLYMHVFIHRPRAGLTKVRVRFLGKNRMTRSQMQQFKILLESRLTHMCHGGMGRSSEILLEESVRGLGRRPVEFNA